MVVIDGTEVVATVIVEADGRATAVVMVVIDGTKVVATVVIESDPQTPQLFLHCP